MSSLTYRHLFFLTAMASVSITPVLADQVVLKNGDRVTGTIVKKQDKELTIKTVYFGSLTTDWSQVESVTSDEPINVVLRDGRNFRGLLSTSNGMVQVNTGAGAVSVPTGEITALRDEEAQKAYERLERPGLLQLWAGTATIGFAGASGNAETSTFTAAVNAARVTRTDKTSLYFNAIKSSALVSGQHSDTAQAVRGGVAYDHNLSPRLFATVFNDNEYDRFQNLDLRVVGGGGLGLHVSKSERGLFDVLAGSDFNHAKFSTSPTRNAGELFSGDDYSLKLSSATSILQSFRFFENLSDTGTYRANFDIGAATKFMKWLTWNLSVSDRYLSKPAPEKKTNDLLYTTGVGITFAR